MTNTIQSVGLAASGNGVSLTASNAGNSQNPILVVKSLIAGSGITIAASDSLTYLIIFLTCLPPLTSLVTSSVRWSGAAPGVIPIFTAAYPLIVTAILGRIEHISSTAGTITLVKAPSGIAVTAGVALASALDVTSTPYYNHTLTLTADITVLTLAVGDSLGFTTTGTWTSASGGITVHMAPAAAFT